MIKRFTAILLTLILSVSCVFPLSALALTKAQTYEANILELKNYLRGEPYSDLTNIFNNFKLLGSYQHSFMFILYTDILLSIDEDEYGLLYIHLNTIRLNQEFCAFLENDEDLGTIDELEYYALGRQAEANGDAEGAIANYMNCMSFMDSAMRLYELQGNTLEQMYQQAYAYYMNDTAEDYRKAYELFSELEKYAYKESSSYKQIAYMLGNMENTASAGEPVENTQYAEWSEWVSELPDTVNDGEYEIETSTQYRYRTREFKTVETASLDGWTLYSKPESGVSYGSWSSWSQDAVEANSSREVQKKTMYRYRDLKTTSSSSSSMSGWEQYNKSSSWGSYGSWSGWSTTPVSSSDSRQVETKKQYRYRDTVTSTGYSDWSSWSSWSTTSASANDLTQVETRTTYRYYYFKCSNCGDHMHGYVSSGECWTWAGGCGKKGVLTVDGRKYVWGTTNPSKMTWKEFKGTGTYYSTYDGYRVFKYSGDKSKSRTEYRKRTRTIVTNTSQTAWSSWSDSAVSSSSTRQVETRTLYRYRDRPLNTTYYFRRWGDWTSWSDSKVSSSSSRDVQTGTFYRSRPVYREEQKYVFYKWMDWSEWTDNSAVLPIASENTEIEERVLYRYKQTSSSSR